MIHDPVDKHNQWYNVYGILISWICCDYYYYMYNDIFYIINIIIIAHVSCSYLASSASMYVD